MTLATVCATHAALAMAEYDQAPTETLNQLRAQRDQAEANYRAQSQSC